VYKGIHKVFTQLKVALKLEIGQSVDHDWSTRWPPLLSQAIA